MNIPIDKQLHIFSGWALCASLLPFTGPALPLLATPAVGAAAEANADPAKFITMWKAGVT